MVSERCHFYDGRMFELRRGANFRTEEKAMMWIDIAVAVLLSLRITLFRPVLPQLVDQNHVAWVPEEKDEGQD